MHACPPARSSPLSSPQLWPPFFVPPHCFASVNWSLEPLYSGLEPTLKAGGGASRWKEETHVEARAHLDQAAAARSPAVALRGGGSSITPFITGGERETGSVAGPGNSGQATVLTHAWVNPSSWRLSKSGSGCSPASEEASVRDCAGSSGDFVASQEP